jgi:hypothetical protein
MRLILAMAVLGAGLGAALADTIPVTISPDDAADSVNTLAGGDDPEWTSASNIDLTGSLLDLITTLGGNSADIAALFQPGAALAGYAGAPSTSSTPSDVVTDVASNVVDDAVSNADTTDSSASTPEPATMGLLFAALLFLIWYAGRRVRKIHRYTSNQHGPLQRSD